MNWKYKVRIKDLFTKNEDWESIQTSMTQIGNILKRKHCFLGFGGLDRFKRIPHGDDFFKPVDYANRLLDEVYAYADENKIWIE